MKYSKAFDKWYKNNVELKANDTGIPIIVSIIAKEAWNAAIEHLEKQREKMTCGHCKHVDDYLDCKEIGIPVELNFGCKFWESKDNA